MQVKCLTSFFTQNQNGVPGQILTINDQQIVDSLVQAGYVEEMQSNEQPPQEVQEKHSAAKARMKKADDSQ